jgi:hypothetical protein
MPPYTPVVSRAQSRALFAKANRGEISMDDAKGKTRAADWKRLPERKGSPRARRRASSR